MPKSLNEGRIGLVAGRGIYPRLVLDGARAEGRELVVAAFDGETEAGNSAMHGLSSET